MTHDREHIRTFACVVVRADLGAPHAEIKRTSNASSVRSTLAGTLVRLLGVLQEIRRNLAHASLHAHDRWFPHCHLDLLRQDPAPSWASEASGPQQNEADGDDTESNKLQACKKKCKNTLNVAANILSCCETRIKMRMVLAVGNIISLTHAHGNRSFTSKENTGQYQRTWPTGAYKDTHRTVFPLQILGELERCTTAWAASPRTGRSWSTLFASRTRCGELKIFGVCATSS